MGLPFCRIVVTATYRFGFCVGGGPQSFGLDTLPFLSTIAFAFDGTCRLTSAMLATASPVLRPSASREKISVPILTLALCAESFSTVTLKSTVADADEISGVVM